MCNLYHSFHNIKKSLLRLALVCIFLPLIQSCIKEYLNGMENPDGIDTEVSISISVPNTTLLISKSLTKDDEETVNTIELLVFDASGKYLYTSNAIDITVNSNPDVRDFKAVLKTGTEDIVLLANCRNLIGDCFPSGIAAGTDKQTIIEQLTLALDGKWITDKTDNDYRSIPMWGEIGTCTITASTTQVGSSPYDIHRMVARVDVTTSLPSQTDFKLTSVRLYYYNDTGSVIPDDTDFSSNLPTVPGIATKVKGPVVYDGTAIAADASGNPACIREIYLFEAEAGSRFNHPNNMCLIVGGEYNGIPGFYRIDFQQTTMQGKNYLNILRNHNYQVIITDVMDIGFPDPDEALEAFPVSLSAQVIDWSEDNSDDINISGNYILKLSTDELVFSPEAGTQYMYIYTNHPQGWKFVRDNFVPDVNWLTISPVNGVQGNLTKVEVTVNENTDAGMRIYEVPVIVDNVSKQIIFAQRGTGDVDLEVFATPNPILVGKYPTQPITITVSTYPVGIPLYFNYEGDIDWEPGGFPTDGTTDRVLSLQPKGNDTDNVLTGFLTIYVKDAAGHTASCVVEIQQVTKIVGLNTELYNKYSAQPGTYKFRVESTVPWQVNYISNGSIWTPNFGMGVQNASAWADYNFTLTGNPDYEDRSVEVSLYAPSSGEYETVEFIQGYNPPSISADDNTIYLPAEGGQKVTHKFKANADWVANVTSISSTNWTSLFSTFNGPSSGTGEGWNMAEYTIELETNDLPESGSTLPLAGQRTYNNAITVTLQNHAPVTGTYTQYFNIVRDIPPVIIPSPNSYPQYRAIYYGNPYNYGSTYRLANETSDPDFYHYLIPGGEHILYAYLQVFTNTAFTYWLESDPTNKLSSGSITSSRTVNLSPGFLIPANTGVSNRLVRICCQPDGSSEIFYINFEQKGTQGITVDIISPTVGSTIPTGGTEIKFRVNDPNNVMTSTLNNVTATLLVGGQVVNLGLYSSGINFYSRYTAAGEYSLYLEPNRKASFEMKDVELIWCVSTTSNESSTNVWHTMCSHYVAGTWKQDYQSQKLSTGYYIAKGSIQNYSGMGYYIRPSTNWTTAMGIEDDKLNSLFFSNTSEWYNYAVRSDLSSDAFSCATYTEPDMPNMKWRVPTVAEMNEMYANRAALGFKIGSTNGSYWTVEEVSAGTATIFNMDTGLTSAFNKSSGGYTRCVSRTTTIP